MEPQKEITVEVLLASGEEDTWNGVTEAQMNMEFGGALFVVKGDEIMGIYAPGMWMKVVYR